MTFYTYTDDQMWFLISIGIGVLVTLGLRAFLGATMSLTLHPVLGIGFALVVTVISYRLLEPLAWLGLSPDVRKYRTKLRSILERRSEDWVGRKFIYIESYRPMHVLVSRVRVGKRGVSFFLRTLPTRGFTHTPGEFRAGAGWDTMFFDNDRICEPNIPWELFLDERTAEQVVQDISECAVEPEQREQSLRILRMVRARLAASPRLSNFDLREEMIPSDSASLDEIAAFALSYDVSNAEAGHPERSNERFKRLMEEYGSCGSLPASLDEARLLLAGIQAMTPGYRSKPARIERELVRHIRHLVRSRDKN